ASCSRICCSSARFAAFAAAWDGAAAWGAVTAAAGGGAAIRCSAGGDTACGDAWTARGAFCRVGIECGEDDTGGPFAGVGETTGAGAGGGGGPAVGSGCTTGAGAGTGTTSGDAAGTAVERAACVQGPNWIPAITTATAATAPSAIHRPRLLDG